MRITIKSPPKTEKNSEALDDFQSLITELIDDRVCYLGRSEWEEGLLHVEMIPGDQGWRRILTIVRDIRYLQFGILMNGKKISETDE